MQSFKIALLLLAALALTLPARAETPVIPCRVVAEYPHDPATSTQGLFYREGLFYESSGGYNRSFLAVVEPETGRHLLTAPVQPGFFAEGIAPYGDYLRMLTWKSGVGMIYTLEDLAPVGSFAFRGTFERLEGWGLTFHDGQFVMSTGEAQLELRAPKTFARTGTIDVTDGGRPVRLLNELEFVNGWLYANIWKSDRIAIIDPADGTVRAWLDLSPLRARLSEGSGVANGIAYDEEAGRLFVTGKLWDRLFEIEAPELR